MLQKVADSTKRDQVADSIVAAVASGLHMVDL
jgi:hypothetical protein